MRTGQNGVLTHKLGEMRTSENDENDDDDVRIYCNELYSKSIAGCRIKWTCLGRICMWIWFIKLFSLMHRTFCISLTCVIITKTNQYVKQKDLSFLLSFVYTFVSSEKSLRCEVDSRKYRFTRYRRRVSVHTRTYAFPRVT